MTSTSHLIESLVEKTLPPKSGQLFLRDDEITGFALRVTSNGAKSFVWEGRINGRTCRDTLGKFPDLSVVEGSRESVRVQSWDRTIGAGAPFPDKPLARNTPRRTHYGPLLDIDFAQAVWRIPNTKSGRPHLLPLPRAAVQIL
jgi:hypothetical protein